MAAGSRSRGADQITYNRGSPRPRTSAASRSGSRTTSARSTARADFDFAVNEQCFQYHECHRLAPFIDAGKNVIIIEYKTELGQFCPDADELGAVVMRKKLSLKVWRQPCP